MPSTMHLCSSAESFFCEHIGTHSSHQPVQGLAFPWGDFIDYRESGYYYDILLFDIWRLAGKIAFLEDCQKVLYNRGVYLWRLICLLINMAK